MAKKPKQAEEKVEEKVEEVEKTKVHLADKTYHEDEGTWTVCLVVDHKNGEMNVNTDVGGDEDATDEELVEKVWGPMSAEPWELVKAEAPAEE